MEGLRNRTKEFSLRMIRLYTALPKKTEVQVIGKQMLRSGTSVAANFREASRARSTAEFVAKLGIVEQELDETMLWLELIVETEMMRRELVESLHGEAEELLKIVITSIRKSRSIRRKSDNSS
ncbi:MAG: four helix bundle protein [Planctomycetes bacterium]|nr:four helix bundle protein [Planctomycetota bacterium]